MLTGEESPVHLRDATAAVADAIPASRTTVPPGVGHGSPTAEQVTETVIDFLRDRTR